MIARLFCFLRHGCCLYRSGERLDRALTVFEQNDARLKRVALDIINESVGPDVQPYTLDRLSDAIADVTRKSAEERRRRAAAARQVVAPDLTAEVLRLTDPRS